MPEIEWLTVKEIAASLCLSVSAVGNMIRAGRIRALNTSSGRTPRYRIRREDFERFIEESSNVRPADTAPARTSARGMPPGIRTFV